MKFARLDELYFKRWIIRNQSNRLPGNVEPTQIEQDDDRHEHNIPEIYKATNRNQLKQSEDNSIHEDESPEEIKNKNQAFDAADASISTRFAEDQAKKADAPITEVDEAHEVEYELSENLSSNKNSL